jgi:hypothetical protein
MMFMIKEYWFKKKKKENLLYRDLCVYEKRQV